jgi:predicted Rossmann fold nucleotide-binding protein DprA/Smf involved in DNA uptake
MDTKTFLLLLSDIPGIGPKTIASIMRRNAVMRRSPEQFFCMTPDQLIREFGMRQDAANCLSSTWPERFEKADELAKFLRRNSVTLITISEALYPVKLQQRLDEPPPILYAYGNSALLTLPLFAVANSNNASEGALASADAASALALDCGWSPVTGHNRFAYQRPALAARRTGGRVCYVLDRGLLNAFGNDLSKQLFPAARIWSLSYDPDRDLTLSPFPLQDHEIGDNNRRRDELIFALADVIFVGTARPKGRMESVCRSALARKQNVFLIGPPSPDDQRLLDVGAKRVDDPAALASELHRISSRTEEEIE